MVKQKEVKSLEMIKRLTYLPACRRYYSVPPSPSPPRLPKEHQEEFERLQKQANARTALEMSSDQLDGVIKYQKTEQTVGAHPEFRQILS